MAIYSQIPSNTMYLFPPLLCFFIVLFTSKLDLSHTNFMSDLFADQDIEIVTWSRMRDIFFSEQILPYKLF